MPITHYRKLLEQALNLIAAYRQIEFSLQTNDDKHQQLLEEYDEFKQFEKLKELEKNNIME